MAEVATVSSPSNPTVNNTHFPVPSPRSHKTNHSPHHPQPPTHLPRSSNPTETKLSSELRENGSSNTNSSGVQVRVSVTNVEDMDEEVSLNLDLPPGVAYQPPSSKWNFIFYSVLVCQWLLFISN